MPHKALWVNAEKTQEVKTVEGNYTPQEEEILLKCICVGVNPADWK
jgi:NADPH:quinone reductase-like Zn-dependent oxidoreductase